MNDLAETTGQALAEALERLREVATVETGAKSLQRRAADVSVEAIDSVIAQVDAFRHTANPQIQPLLRQQIADLMDEYLRLLDGQTPQNWDFVERFARATAEQYFPLEALLHSYRLVMQKLLQTTTATLLPKREHDGVEVVNAAMYFLLEFFNVASTLATEHYLDHSRLLADVASDQRSELLAILLGGADESDRRVSAILRDAGYLDRRLRFCVVLAQSIDPSEMHNPARARRLADTVDRLLAHLPGKRLIDLHRHKVTIVFSHQHRLSGWSAPRESLAARVAQAMLKVGPAARMGVSNDIESTAQIPAAYRQAALAFDNSSIGQRVVQFSDIPLQQLLLTFAQEEFSRVLPHWAQAFHEADARSRGRLNATLRAYAENNMNLLKTARQLGIHANTVYARFDRILAMTGRDARGFDALNELLIVAATPAS